MANSIPEVPETVDTGEILAAAHGGSHSNN
jgi:hypothetical protein